jgi:hypothetical protein
MVGGKDGIGGGIGGMVGGKGGGTGGIGGGIGGIGGIGGGTGLVYCCLAPSPCLSHLDCYPRAILARWYILQGRSSTGARRQHNLLPVNVKLRRDP